MVRARGLGARLELLLDPVECFRQGTGHEPQPWQPAYMRETRNAIVLKGRQVGASTCTGIKGVRKAILIPRFHVGIVSPSLYQSKEVKDRAKLAAERLGEKLVGDSAREIEFANGSRITSLPGSRKSVRGYTFDFLVIDEAAFLDQETFLAARATVATGGEQAVQSTPAGPFGHFHDLWEDPDEGWAKYLVRSDEVSTISAEFLAKERRNLSQDEFDQEYGAKFAAAGMGLVDPAELARLTAEPAPETGSVWDRARKAAES